ncbi:MAG: hypothetical protein JWO78_422 [Micavibrio sp.]|nr:hypothetical protein [Micavibrio sp.]
MVLPETALLVGLLVFGAYITDHFGLQPGQQAMASVNGMIQDGVPTPEMRHRHRNFQKKIQNDPQSLLHMDVNDVIGALGYSDLKRDDGDVTVLQFRGESCVLDIYLNKASASATNYEFRPRLVAGTVPAEGRDDIRPQHCVDDILKSHHL